MSITVTVDPTAEPILLADAKTHLNLTSSFTDDDVYITALVVLARKFVENYTRRALMEQTIVARHDGFPRRFRVERPPLQSVTSIQYVDGDGATQTLAASEYDVDIYSTPARITEAYGVAWPGTRNGVPNTVTVTYVAGGVDSDAVPDGLIHVIKLLLTHWYENREPIITGTIISNVPMTVQTLLMHYKVSL